MRLPDGGAATLSINRTGYSWPSSPGQLQLLMPQISILVERCENLLSL